MIWLIALYLSIGFTVGILIKQTLSNDDYIQSFGDEEMLPMDYMMKENPKLSKRTIEIGTIVVMTLAWLPVAIGAFIFSSINKK